MSTRPSTVELSVSVTFVEAPAAKCTRWKAKSCLLGTGVSAERVRRDARCGLKKPNTTSSPATLPVLVTVHV